MLLVLFLDSEKVEKFWRVGSRLQNKTKIQNNDFAFEALFVSYEYVQIWSKVPEALAPP